MTVSWVDGYATNNGASTTAPTVKISSAAHAGDVAVVAIFGRGVNLTAPSGWTQQDLATDSDTVQVGVWTKTLVAGEPGSTITWGQDVAGTSGVLCGVWTGSPVVAGHAMSAFASASTSPVCPSVPSGQNGGIAVSIVAGRASTSGQFPSFSVSSSAVVREQTTGASGRPQSGVLVGRPLTADGATGTQPVTASAALAGQVATVLLNPPNVQAPVAAVAVSPQTGATPLQVTANAANSTDPQGQTLTYAFDFGDGTTTPASSSTSAQHTYSTTGTFTVKVTVTNTSGLSSTAATQVTASAPQQTPTQVSWVDGSATNFGAATAAPKATLPSGAHAGDLALVQITVRGANLTAPSGWTQLELATDSDTVQVGVWAKTLTADDLGTTPTWSQDAAAPSAVLCGVWTGMPVLAGHAMSPFSSSTTPVCPSIPGAQPGAVVVSLVGGRPSTSGQFPSFSVPSPAVLREQITGSSGRPQSAAFAGRPVTASGATGTQPVTASAALAGQATSVVLNPPGLRAPSAALSLAPAAGAAPLQVRADASASSDPQGQALSFGFDFGDGTTVPAGSVYSQQHTYSQPGQFTVTVTVTNAGGASATASAQVTASTPPPPPDTTFHPQYNTSPTALAAGAAVYWDGTVDVAGTAQVWDGDRWIVKIGATGARPYFAGLADRQNPASSSLVGAVPNTVIQPDLSAIWKARGVYDWTYIDQALQANGAAHCVRQRLRCRGSVSVPQWVLDATADITYSLGGTVYHTAPWWRQDYQDLRHELEVAMAARYDSDPRLNDIMFTASGVTFGAEWTTRPLSDSGNGQIFVNAGYTIAADQAAIRAGINQLHTLWPNTACSTFLSVLFKGPGPDGKTVQDQAFTDSTIGYMRSKRSSWIIGANNLDDTAYSDDINGIYSMLLKYGGNQVMQTSTLPKMGNDTSRVVSAVRQAIQHGVFAVELPFGYDPIGYQTLADLNAGLIANTPAV